MRFLISAKGDLSEAMSKSKKKTDIKGEEEEMSELEIIRQKCEVQKKQSGYEKRIRKQVKEKLGKIKNQYRGELS